VTIIVQKRAQTDLLVPFLVGVIGMAASSGTWSRSSCG
jgi:hypothetical protein